MSIAARTSTAEQRAAIFDRLDARNRLVSVLRFGLPVIGAIIFAGLILQLYLGSLVPSFGFANIRIDRENIVVDRPAYEGTAQDGTRYFLEALGAKVALDDTDLVNLTEATITMTQPDQSSFTASAPQARVTMSTSVVKVDGVTTIRTTGGTTGTLGNGTFDVNNEKIDAPGGVDLQLNATTHLKASAMTYDGSIGIWAFTRVVLDLDETPGEADYVSQPAETTP